VFYITIRFSGDAGCYLIATPQPAIDLSLFARQRRPLPGKED
jgi:hypothetical protein